MQGSALFAFVTASATGFRRTLAVGVVWLAAMAALLVTSPAASGQEAVAPGRGQAIAQGVKVDPRTGQLSFGITYGLAIAGHQNTVAIGEARSADLGVIGTTLAGEGCDGGDPTLPKEDQPQPLVARSTEESAGEPKDEAENGVERRVVANSDPFASAEAITAGGGEPGVLEIGQTRSYTESGIVDGARQARAVTELGSISLAGGQVILRGLRWEAFHRSAPNPVNEGSFTIDGIEIAGQAVPISEDNPLGPLGEANAVLNPLGFEIQPPQVRFAEGIQFVDPIRIGIVPGQLQETILSPIFEAIQPIRESVFDALIEADCSNGSYITVLDIVLNSFSGAGAIGFEVGGVRATTAEIAATSFLGGLPTPTPGTPATPVDSGTGSTGSLGSSGSSGSSGSGSSSLGGSTGSTGSGSVATPSQPTTSGTDSSPSQPVDEVAIGDVDEVSGRRGGPLVGVGLAGLLLLAALAEGDRRKMRRAQRSIPLEATA